MFDHLLELSHRDNSNKWSNVGFGEEIDFIEIKIRASSGVLYSNILCDIFFNLKYILFCDLYWNRLTESSL